MSSNKIKLLIVGSFPPKNRKVIGGIEKSSRILVNSKFLTDFRLIKFDTSQISNPPPKLIIRFLLSIIRLTKYLIYLLIYRPNKVLIFCSDGASALEKGFMIILSKIFHIKSLIFPRAGNLINQTKKNKLFKNIIKFLFSKADFFLCQGPVWYNFAINDLRINKQNVDIINNWTASEELLKVGKNRIISKKREPTKIIFIGWLEKEKGINELLEAFNNIQKKYPVEINFVGDGSLRKKIESFRDINNLHKKVIISGWLNDDKIISNLQKSDIFILPSWQEGMPNSLIESLASGLPSIVTSVGSIPDYVINNKTALLIEPKNILDIQKAMLKLLNDFNLRKKMAKNATILSENSFSEANEISKLNSIIFKL